MKSIDTLIEDIHGALSGDHQVSKEAVQEFGTRLAAVITRRLFEEVRPHKQDLRMSNLGTPCERKLWYSISDDHVPEPLPPHAKVKFLFGDILEELVLFLAEAAGHDVQHKQHEVTLNGVRGHIDAVIDGVLVDVKSASTRSYDKFSRHELGGNDPFGYIDQLNAYHFALTQSDVELDKEHFAFLVIGKELGHICLDKHYTNGVDYNKVIDEKRSVLDKPTPPKRSYFDEPDGKSGNRKLPVVCGYCDYKFNCWPNVRTFIYSNGPRFLTEVVRVPDVPEAI